jgi:hypothetical protein
VVVVVNGGWWVVDGGGWWLISDISGYIRLVSGIWGGWRRLVAWDLESGMPGQRGANRARKNNKEKRKFRMGGGYPGAHSASNALSTIQGLTFQVGWWWAMKQHQ